MNMTVPLELGNDFLSLHMLSGSLSLNLSDEAALLQVVDSPSSKHLKQICQAGWNAIQLYPLPLNQPGCHFTMCVLILISI